MSGYDTTLINDRSLREPFYPGSDGISRESGNTRRVALSNSELKKMHDKKEDHWSSIFGKIEHRSDVPFEKRKKG